MPEVQLARLRAPVCGDAAAALAPVPVSAGLSWRSNFAWALSGNVVYAACQWCMVIALAKLGNSYMVGQFSLGLALAAPVMMFTNLQLRAVEATDARRQYGFGEYLGLRVVTTAIALAVIVAITGVGRYQRETALVILAVAAVKALESFSDVFYGLFQLNDRLDQTGKSMMLRGAFSVIGLSAGLYVTKSVVWGVAVLAVIWLAVLISFDVRRGLRLVSRPRALHRAGNRESKWGPVRPKFNWRAQWSLTRLALPLGFVMTLVSLNQNMPRYFIHTRWGEYQLGIYSAMAYTTVAVATFADALGHSTIPIMSRLYASGQLGAFRAFLLKLVALGALLGLAGFVTTKALGPGLLTVLFSSEYAGHSAEFVWLIVAAGISCVASLLNYGITAARCFRIQVPMFLLVPGSNALACIWLVPSRGLAGAAFAMVIAAVVHLTLASSVLLYVLTSPPKCAAEDVAPGFYCDNWETRL